MPAEGEALWALWAYPVGRGPLAISNALGRWASGVEAWRAVWCQRSSASPETPNDKIATWGKWRDIRPALLGRGWAGGYGLIPGGLWGGAGAADDGLTVGWGAGARSVRPGVKTKVKGR